jgi:manganese/zinc/iron transport system substrate-binding protein|tara:strand:- start:437 stop:1393 length:957 start_codon:yes stop_codon:yes gene_type:complete
MKFIPSCWAVALGALVLFTTCSRDNADLGAPNGAAAGKLKVVATTTMITDLVRQVGGDLVDVQGLMGVGVDPHGYTAKPSDADKLKAADMIIYNGLMLEGQIEPMLKGMKKNKKHVYAVTDKIPRDKLLKPEEFEGHHDPHVWFDPTLWVHCLDTVVEGLSKADVANKVKYEKRGAKLRVEFLALHEWAKGRMTDLPEKPVLITSHDAFNYFGRAYNLEVVGLQGISTDDEASTKQYTRIADLIKNRKVKAVFTESSVNSAPIEQLCRDTGTVKGGELFSDAMGQPGKMMGPEGDQYNVGTYQGMIRHNVNTVVKSLK